MLWPLCRGEPGKALFGHVLIDEKRGYPAGAQRA